MTVDHKEREFEASIVSHLVENCGYVEGDPGDFDSHIALMPEIVIEFIRNTQPRKWEKLSEIHQARVQDNFIKRLCKELDAQGMLHVLRHGVTDYGVHFDLMYSAPQSRMNPESLELFNKNILSVTRQVYHSVRNPKDAVDLMFFVNGLPVATAELKTQFTGQNYKNAIKQYRETRDPRDPVFTYMKRTLVHFAVDTDEVWMTTRLNRGGTDFLPFNRGHNNGAGNPVNPDGYRSSYLWEYVLEKNSWIDILSRFMHREVKKDGGKIISQQIIFPRFHQLDSVRRLQNDVLESGVGKNYLIQHSAGSGKSNSIAWLAYRLASLHNEKDNLIFDSVIVVTDRRVLDQQLQDTIYQFEHQMGVVEPIDKHSDQLAKALESGAKIIITTLQKFPFVTDKINELPQRNYAVIVDEAHSSQTGESAKEMKAVLSTSLEDAEKEALAEEENIPDYEDELIRSMEARGQHDNLSFFAFTATPKYKTLEMFGTTGEDGKPHPFHLYSMKQAIEEEFILDVLHNYTTYHTYFRVAKRIEDDPRFDKKKASQALMKYISKHPHNIQEKTKVIVEHFYHTVRHQLNGRAKAMVVTASRLHAVLYYLEVKRYIKEQGYEGSMKHIVAFSGKVKDGAMEYSEHSLNGFSDKEIPEQFKTDYNLLVVAYKFQTGFDQPLLNTMYVDQKLQGVKAVQTLSRLNRKYPGKKSTFVLDFVNTQEEIQQSFEPYYKQTNITETTDPNDLYTLKTEIDAFQISWPQEIENFVNVFFTKKNSLSKKDQGLLNSFIDPAVERFNDRSEEEQDSFRASLNGFVKLYSYISHIMPFSDMELEKLFVYGRFLIKKLRGSKTGEPVFLDDDVALQYYRLLKTSDEVEIGLTGESDEIETDVKLGKGSTAKELVNLSELISRINELFGDFDFGDPDMLFVDQVRENLSKNERIKEQARNNTLENFKFGVEREAMDAVISSMTKNEKLAKYFIDNEQFRNIIIEEYIAPVLYDQLRQVRASDQ